MKRRPTLLGVPIDSSGNPSGCKRSPAVLRQHGLAQAVDAQDDLGDLPIGIVGPRDMKSGVVGYASVLEVTSTVREKVGAMLGAGRLPLLVGGCCSFVMGAIAGARDAYGRVGLAYVDEHLDLYDGKTSPTGECADMPFAFLTGRAPPEMVQRMGTACPIIASDAALLGFRSGRAL